MSIEPGMFWQLRYRRVADIVHRDIGGEHLLVPVKGNLVELHAIYSLNEVAAAIWEKLDGNRAMAAIRDELAQEYDTAAEGLESDIREAVLQFANSGLVEVVE